MLNGRSFSPDTTMDSSAHRRGASAMAPRTAGRTREAVLNIRTHPLDGLGPMRDMGSVCL